MPWQWPLKLQANHQWQFREPRITLAFPGSTYFHDGGSFGGSDGGSDGDDGVDENCDNISGSSVLNI